MRVVKDIHYSNEQIEAKTLDIYLPQGKTDSVFLYMHGGGLESGSKEWCAESIASVLTERGVAFVSINYRMYPDAAYPDFINDSAEAVAYVRQYMENTLGCDRLYVGGSSAGAYLSMMLCFDRQYLARVGVDSSDIAGYFHDAGQPTAHFNVLKNRGEDSRRVIVDTTAPLGESVILYKVSEFKVLHIFFSPCKILINKSISLYIPQTKVFAVHSDYNSIC